MLYACQTQYFSSSSTSNWHSCPGERHRAEEADVPTTRPLIGPCTLQHHLFLLYQSVILSVIDYGLGLTNLSQSNLLMLDRVQNEAMKVILETTKDTPIEAMRYLQDLPSMETRHTVEQVKAYLDAMQNPNNPLHIAVKEEKGCRLSRGKSWMRQAEQSIQHVCALAELKQVKDWGKRPVEFKPYYKTMLSENLGTHCRE